MSLNNFKVRMIRIKGNEVSEKYARYCAGSWFGTNFAMVDAVTPETLSEQSGLTFGIKPNGKELTDTEKACFYSQYNLWVKCARENYPILVAEHDAFLRSPSVINFNPSLEVQFFGQHAMEAVMYSPLFCRRLIDHCSKNEVIGPMNCVDGLLGYFKRNEQSRHALPHARYQGQRAPVVSVIDSRLGTTVEHAGMTTLDRLKDDADLFRVVDLTNFN